MVPPVPKGNLVSPLVIGPNGELWLLSADANGYVYVNVGTLPTLAQLPATLDGGNLRVQVENPNLMETPHVLLDGTIDSDTDPGAAAKGYIIVGTDIGGGVLKWQRLAPGAAGQVLVPDAGGVLSWVDPLSLAHFGYTLMLGALLAGFSPADSTPYYAGSQYAQVMSGTESTVRVLVPKAGTIKQVDIHFQQTIGTGEQSRTYMMLNGVQQAQINFSVYNLTADFYEHNTYSLAVALNDAISFKWVTPAWVTNPTQVKVHVSVYIE